MTIFARSVGSVGVGLGSPASVSVHTRKREPRRVGDVSSRGHVVQDESEVVSRELAVLSLVDGGVGLVEPRRSVRVASRDPSCGVCAAAVVVCSRPLAGWSVGHSENLRGSVRAEYRGSRRRV